VLVPRVAVERGAERAEGVRVDGSEGFQRTRSLPGSLYATSSLLGTLCTSEAEYEQHSDRHPLLWSRSTAIPTISRILDPIREIFATVVGRVLPHPNRRTAASYPSVLPFQCTLPSQLDVPRDTAKLRGRQREDSFIRYLEHDANIGGQRFASIPPRPRAEVLLANTGAPEDADFNRHKAHVTEENVECSSAFGSCQVEYRLRVRPAVRVVKLVLNILFRSSFVPTIHRPGLILSSCLDGMIFFYRLTNRSR